MCGKLSKRLSSSLLRTRLGDGSSNKVWKSSKETSVYSFGSGLELTMNKNGQTSVKSMGGLLNNLAKKVFWGLTENWENLQKVYLVQGFNEDD